MRSVLLDSNMLLLFLVGNLAPDRVGQVKGLKEYERADVHWVNTHMRASRGRVSLPNILTEVSNLIGEVQIKRGELVPGLNEAFADFVHSVSEVYEKRENVVVTPEFLKLGLSDAAIVKLARDQVTVLTADRDLFGVLASQNVDVHNIWHHKTPR